MRKEGQHTYSTPSVQTRYCPEHAAVMLAHVGDQVYQCPIDGKMYNYVEGYTADGEKIPGASIAGQTPEVPYWTVSPAALFETRPK